MTLTRNILVVPGVHTNSDSNMLCFMAKVTSVLRMVRSKLRQRESGQDVITSAGIQPELKTALMGGARGHVGPWFTLQLCFCKNNFTPEGYHRPSGAHSLTVLCNYPTDGFSFTATTTLCCRNTDFQAQVLHAFTIILL